MGSAYQLNGKRVWVAGHTAWSARRSYADWRPRGCDVLTAARSELDLRDQADVRAWTEKRRPQAVFLAAARVGGILANDSYPADFLYQNLLIEMNIIGAAFDVGVEKLLFLGSSCIYPKMAPQPITEDALLYRSA